MPRVFASLPEGMKGSQNLMFAGFDERFDGKLYLMGEAGDVKKFSDKDSILD